MNRLSRMQQEINKDGLKSLSEDTEVSIDLSNMGIIIRKTKDVDDIASLNEEEVIRLYKFLKFWLGE